MATLQLLLHHHSHSFPLNSHTNLNFSSNYPIFTLLTQTCNKLPPPRCSTTDDAPSTTTPRRRGRKKSTSTTDLPASAPKRSKRPTKRAEPSNSQNEAVISKESDHVEELFDFDDGIDFPYEDPPLVCCFGAVQKEFLPTVRVAPEQMHPDIYSQWKMLQWNPPEFVRAPGGPPSNVAISHVRLGGRAAFIGKVGNDEFGEELVLMMNKEKVQTRGVKFDDNVRTACSYMKINFGDGKMWAEKVKECAEDSMLGSELNLSVLKEARIFHFNSEVLTSTSMRSTLFKAIAWSKKFGSLVFFDLNLPLPLWKSCDETREVIKEAWEKQTSLRWNTSNTLLLPSFDGVVVGTEDVLITPFTCDRTGSGDAIVAGIMRKLTTQPEMFDNQDLLERQLRFAIAAGIISQWTIGAVRGFPTESAAQNLKEQVYVPSMCR
ncbi:UNVERIFIED_CONTAM: Fructokinase-like 1, chloroplastic [Sesamum radiatum]|uniref:Fructokinase-like 1, chloroplastic n=1 Tax=Sesamum radiatum TaxID=300843 RepID=A0AAW2LAQ1_SESRA